MFTTVNAEVHKLKPDKRNQKTGILEIVNVYDIDMGPYALKKITDFKLVYTN